MIIYMTETRKTVAKEFYFGEEKRKTILLSETKLDGLKDVFVGWPGWEDTLEDMPLGIITAVEKPVMQRVLEASTPEKILFYEAYNEMIDGASTP